MSGDVQPRKRKDKRRKKEGSSLGSIHEPISSHKFKRSESADRKIFEVPDQGEKIHVQNEHGVGGNICVKIIFFCLFGLLLGAVGLIYIKSLGSTDVDLPTIEESQFAEYFTGWLDDSPDEHEHEALEHNLDHDLFENDDENEIEHDEHDDDEHENEEDQSSVQDSIFKLFGLQSDELEEAEESVTKVDKITENEESGIRQDVNDDDDDDDNGHPHDGDEDSEEEHVKDKVEAEEEEGEEEEEENDMNEEENKDEEENNDSGIDLNEQDDEKSEKDDEENENNLSQMDEDDDLFQVDEEDGKKYDALENKVRKVNEEGQSEVQEKILTVEENFDENEEDDSDDDDNKDEMDENEVGEVKQENEEDEEQEEESNEKEANFKVDNDFGYEEIDISEEDLEEVEQKVKADKIKELEEQSKEDIGEDKREKLESKKVESDTKEDEEEAEADFGGVAVKLGVGIALIIVAHLVLVKKWKSMSNAPFDENVSTETETVPEKKKVENLHSSVEPVISRRQTLVPENVSFNKPYEEEMEDEEENVEDEEYSEEECEEEEFKKSNSWGAFQNPSWNIKRNEYEGDEEIEDNEEFEDQEKEKYEEKNVEDINDEEEEEEEEEVEEVEEEEEEVEEVEEEEEEVEEVEEEVEEEEEGEHEEEEEDYEDDDEIDRANDFVKQKISAIVDEEKREEVKEVIPTPPPRTKTGRGAQEIDEDLIKHSQEMTEIEESSLVGPKAGDETNKSGQEEQKTPEKKVGNEDEWAFRQEFDFAEEQFENNPKAAVAAYNKIISKKPTMTRALIGRARALDHWAEKEKSNTYLKQAINAYKSLLLNHSHLLSDEMYVKLAERCIERMRFAGSLISAVDIHKALILKYPSIPKYRNALAVTYLMLNKIPQARVLLNETLSLWPEDGLALVHYGFILKTSDNNMEEGAKKLMAGIQTRQEGVIDGMFFFHLGDALNRLGRVQEAMKWYELGVKEGLFLSKYQRSLYNVNRLKGQPWWTKEETTYQDFFMKLEDNWKEIRREGLELLNSKGVNLFKEEAENLKDTGDWKQLDLYFRGRKQSNCNKAPITCSLVSSFKHASTCTRGQIKFSVMLPNTHVWPHCGPTNCRLRSHLGLVVPKKTFIRVAEETRSWEEGKFIIFDDSFEHEVWHNGTGLRLVLIVDVWHPELTNSERRYLSPI